MLFDLCFAGCKSLNDTAPWFSIGGKPFTQSKKCKNDNYIFL